MMFVSLINIVEQLQKVFLFEWHTRSKYFIYSVTSALSNILFMEFGFEMLVLDGVLLN